MNQDILHYTVISLTNKKEGGVNEVEEVIKYLEDTKMRILRGEMQERVENAQTEVSAIEILIGWLQNKKDAIYGETVGDWKPFGEQKITEIVQICRFDVYKPDTTVFGLLNENCTNIFSLRNIRVYFIDLFALYLRKYRILATRLDFSFCDVSMRNCCFLIDDKLPYEAKAQLKKMYQYWPAVTKCRDSGYLITEAREPTDINIYMTSTARSLLELDIPSQNFTRKTTQFYNSHGISEIKQSPKIEGKQNGR